MGNKEINEPGHRLKKSAERGFDRMTTLIIFFCPVEADGEGRVHNFKENQLEY